MEPAASVSSDEDERRPEPSPSPPVDDGLEEGEIPYAAAPPDPSAEPGEMVVRPPRRWRFSVDLAEEILAARPLEAGVEAEAVEALGRRRRRGGGDVEEDLWRA